MSASKPLFLMSIVFLFHVSQSYLKFLGLLFNITMIFFPYPDNSVHTLRNAIILSYPEAPSSFIYNSETARRPSSHNLKGKKKLKLLKELCLYLIFL